MEPLEDIDFGYVITLISTKATQQMQRKPPN